LTNVAVIRVNGSAVSLAGRLNAQNLVDLSGVPRGIERAGSVIRRRIAIGCPACHGTSPTGSGDEPSL
jgi:hypothetical protein